MNTPSTKLAERIDRAIVDCVPDRERPGGSIWHLPVQPDSTSEMEIRLHGEWLFVRTALKNGASEHDAWGYLCRQGRDHGQSKVTMRPGDQALYIQQDVLVVADGDVSALCRQAITGVQRAHRQLCKADHDESSGWRVPGSAPWDDVAAEVSGARQSVKEACKATGWSFREREGGQLAVRLDVPGRLNKALLDLRSTREGRVAAQMARYDSLASTQREAVATFLLQANGWIRYARAAVQATPESQGVAEDITPSPILGDSATTAFCEVCFTDLPSEIEIDHALSALSVACSFCTRELDSLRDEHTARAFLNMRGRHAPSPLRVSVEEG